VRDGALFLSRMNAFKAECFSMPSREPAGVWARHSRIVGAVTAPFCIHRRGNERQCSIPPLAIFVPIVEVRFGSI